MQYKFAYQAVIDFAEEALKGQKGDIYELYQARYLRLTFSSA